VFAVVEGEGWVRGADGERAEVRAGDVVVWETGEDHDSGTESGMLVCIVQTSPDPGARFTDPKA
jgi:quercetin dioxygenase-like cupin family protein